MFSLNSIERKLDSFAIDLGNLDRRIRSLEEKANWAIGAFAGAAAIAVTAGVLACLGLEISISPPGGITELTGGGR